MRQVIEEFSFLLNETADYLETGHALDEQKRLSEFLRDFQKQRLKRLEISSQSLNSRKYSLAMVGLTNVGKSTLSEALLGHPVAPKKNAPLTNALIEYRYHKGWVLKIHGKTGIDKLDFDSPMKLSFELNQLMNRDGEAKHQKFIVNGPMKILNDKLVLIDTPGFGAIEGDSPSGQSQEEVVKDIKKQAQEVFFCVSGANGTIKPQEKKFFENIKDLCSTVVVTKWEDDEDSAKQRYESHFKKLFPYCSFSFVSAKEAIRGNADGEILVEALRQRIQKAASPKKRVERFSADVRKAWEDLHELVESHNDQAGGIEWRQDSLIRFKHECTQNKIYLKPFGPQPNTR